MTRPEQIPVVRHWSIDRLNQQIKKLEKNAKILQRLYFIKYRYSEKSVEEAGKLVGITKNNGYIWQSRWNEDGYEGLIPRFAGGKPSKISKDQKADLKEKLETRHDWTTEEVRELIFKTYGIEYTSKQIRIILKQMRMNHAKPFVHDYRRPDDAEEQLKKTTEN